MKKHPYLTREFWLDRQKNYEPNINFTDKGNLTVKETIDNIVNSFSIKDNFIAKTK
jgi:hypothetical protein